MVGQALAFGCLLLKSMFVRTARCRRGCGGRKLFPSGAFGCSGPPCINRLSACNCKWIDRKKNFYLLYFNLIKTTSTIFHYVIKRLIGQKVNQEGRWKNHERVEIIFNHISDQSRSLLQNISHINVINFIWISFKKDLHSW